MRYPFSRFFRLQASTLIETIVASIIFLCVFGMAMDTLTRLFASGRDEADYLLVESVMNRQRRALEQHPPTGASAKSYPYRWGELRIEMHPYGESSNLLEVDMQAVTLRKKEINYRFIIRGGGEE
ncbi:MAG: hypothetical protein LBN24_13755 [Mediterranea sp.]|jgi:hypothetical protein|nr:hypothetical protein [Mediterranea sp.]